MAFTPQEQAIIQAGVKAGKSRADIETAVSNYRLGIKPVKAIEEKKTEPSYLTKVGEEIAGGVSKIREGFDKAKTGKGGDLLSPLESGLKTIEGGARAVLSPLTPLVEPVVKPIAEGVRDISTAIAESPEVQRFAESKAGEATARGAEIIGGLATTAGLVTGGMSPRALKALTPADDFLNTARQSTARVVETVPKASPDIIKDIRFALSDLDPQVETILKRSSFDDVNRYFQQARNAKLDPQKVTPLELAGQKAEDAFDLIDKARTLAIQGKKSILDEVGTERVSGSTLNEVLSSSIQRLESKFGAKVSSKGEISQAQGRTIKLDDADQKLISNYISRLNSLGIAPTVKQIDDFVDWAQSQLYKQSKTTSKYEVASDSVISELRATTGDLNQRLKAAVGNGYGEVNERISYLIGLQDELSRALGADARKGGGLMKKLFSPAGGDTRRIFEEIKRITGVDLFKEATLAKFAMEGVGDVRQSSLLKSLDVAVKGARELDITKPSTWFDFLRENADLDAQELANEFIRRSNASK